MTEGYLNIPASDLMMSALRAGGVAPQLDAAATGIPHVRPGDLIRAEDVNAIIDLLGDLVTRVSRLEGADPGGDAPRITLISPDIPRVGDLMQIVGANFGFSTGAAEVRFDTTVVTAYKIGSSDNLLIFDVPEIAGLPDTGRAVVLRVANRTASVSRAITVLPRATVPQGDVTLSYAGPTAGTPVPSSGRPFIVGFLLHSRSNVEFALSLSATVSVSAWQNGVQILDANLQAVPGAQIRVPSQADVKFHVQVQVPVGTANGTQFTVTTGAQGQGLSLAAGPLPYTVGTEAPPQDENIDLPINGVDSPAVLSGNTVQIARGQRATVRMSAVFAQIGTYTVTLSTLAGWQVTSTLPADGKYVIESSDLGSDGKARKSFVIRATAPGTPTAPTGMTVTGQAQGSSKKKEQVVQFQAT